ncbi:MAG TPA: hypothetical protein VGR43_07800 [Dehalococcoidia bacterium]|nr:hypothetical protein [Dehalococcoidia bacterium]
MNEEAVIQRLIQLNEQYQIQWDADVAAVRVLVAEEELLPLRMGDLFNTLKERWGRKMPDLAKQAGVSPHTARQRARIAARFPVGCVLRAMSLPFSILRLLAPLAEPEPWAERARAQQDAGELHVRAFAHELEEAGLRRRRPRRPPHCLHCGAAIAEQAERVSVRGGERSGQLCGAPCAAAYFTALVSNPLPTTTPSATQPRSAVLRPTPENPESPRHNSQSKTQNPKSKIEPPPHRTTLFPLREDTESHRITLPCPPPADEEARILAILTAEEEAGVGRLLSRRVHPGLPHLSARAPATSLELGRARCAHGGKPNA